MLARVLTSLGLALMGVLATTGSAFAAELSERDEVMIMTAAAVAVLMVLLTIFAAIKHFLGLDRMPPAELDSHEGGHH